jgi:hypothetical protein
MRLEKLLDFRKGQLVLFDPCRLAKIAQLDPEVRLDQPSAGLAVFSAQTTRKRSAAV